MPQVEHSTTAGFPSPAADFETQGVDLVEQLGLDEPSTFLARARGLSMIAKGTLKLGPALTVGRDTGQRSLRMMKQERRTPRYTTRAGALVVVTERP